MAKFSLLLVQVFAVLGFLVFTSTATVYTVGDNSGWDISSDLQTWVKDKVFEAGDVLWFQYSSYHSVSEVTKDNYNGCNVTNALSTSTNGNTTIPLSTPGERFFVCGNKLHCLGGMKLQVNVNLNQANSPAGAPQIAESGSPSSLPGTSKKTPSIPTSTGFLLRGRDIVISSFVVTLFSFSISVI